MVVVEVKVEVDCMDEMAYKMAWLMAGISGRGVEGGLEEFRWLARLVTYLTTRRSARATSHGPATRGE